MRCLCVEWTQLSINAKQYWPNYEWQTETQGSQACYLPFCTHTRNNHHLVVRWLINAWRRWSSLDISHTHLQNFTHKWTTPYLISNPKMPGTSPSNLLFILFVMHCWCSLWPQPLTHKLTEHLSPPSLWPFPLRRPHGLPLPYASHFLSSPVSQRAGCIKPLLSSY